MKKSCNAQGSSKYYLFVTAPFTGLDCAKIVSVIIITGRIIYA